MLSVKGNQLTLQNDSTTRVRDKNKVKLLKKKKSRIHQKKEIHFEDPESEAELEVQLTKEPVQPQQQNQPPQQGLLEVPPEPPQLQPEPPQQGPTDEDEEMTNHLMQLLARAEAREAATRNDLVATPRAGPVTRSRGVVLAWSPTMNGNNPLSENEQ